MRKYDAKNKRNIAIILVISVIIIIMFSLVIKLFLSTDKKEYEVSPGTLVFDKDKTIVKLDNNGIIKQKWNKEYYLIYDKKNIELGDTAISYNESNGEIHLYGRYYEISSGDEINITSGETIIKSSALTKFYKLADRKYLVVDKEIKSLDGLLNTSDFLMVDLDKVGNATLTNNKVNLKTFSATTIVTSNYTFDIANEILTYGSDKIDLKKIIGSSNTFTKEDLVPSEESNGGNGIAGEKESDNKNKSEKDTKNNDTEKQNDKETTNKDAPKERNKTIIEEVKKADKRTSVISITSTVSKIVVDYVIYDPKNEYTSVYMEVQKEGSSSVDTIYLNNNKTTYELTNNILPNTTYNLTFKYTYIDENNNIMTETFDESKVTTKKPNVSISVSRIKPQGITYYITDDNTCNITSATLELISHTEEGKQLLLTKQISIIKNNPMTISFQENGLNITKDTVLELKLSNINGNGTIIKDLEASTKFRY